VSGQNDIDQASYHYLPIDETRPAKILWEITGFSGEQREGGHGLQVTVADRGPPLTAAAFNDRPRLPAPSFGGTQALSIDRSRAASA